MNAISVTVTASSASASATYCRAADKRWTAGSRPSRYSRLQLFLYSCGGASVYLRMDGSIAIKGNADAEAAALSRSAR